MLSEVEYLKALVGLTRAPDTHALLETALAAVVARTDARYGYIEVEAEPTDGQERKVWRAVDCSVQHVELIQCRISRGIIGAAQRGGVTVASASAMADARFGELDSVREYEIGAGLCAPFGHTTCGVLYVQGRTHGGEFTDQNRSDVEQAAQQLELLFERLPYGIGPQPPLREQQWILVRAKVAELIAKHGRNISLIARETRMSRSFIRKLLGARRKPR